MCALLGRSYKPYLLKQWKLEPGSVENHVAALRLFFVRTLNRQQFRHFLPYPRVRSKLPNIRQPSLNAPL